MADRSSSRSHSFRAPISGAMLGLVITLAALVFTYPALAQDDGPPTCNGEAATIEAVAGEPTLGTDEADVIVGTSGPDNISGLGGDDIICGLGGDDVINAGGGHDYINAGGGADQVHGGKAGDTIIGSSGDDRIWGDSGHDVISGSKGDDEISGGSGHDTIRGKSGNDDIRGKSGEDSLSGGRGDDELRGGGGGDELLGKSGDDLLRGGKGVDECIGGSGRDALYSCNEPPPLPAGDVIAVGDSVMLGATTPYCNTLTPAIPGIVENATVSRQFSAGQSLIAGSPDGQLFVIGLGTNGPTTSGSFNAMLETNATFRFVIINIHAPRFYEDSVNEILSDGVARYANRAVLVDWYSAVRANPGYVASDAIHLTCAGAAAYAQLIAEGLRYFS